MLSDNFHNVHKFSMTFLRADKHFFFNTETQLLHCVRRLWRDEVS